MRTYNLSGLAVMTPAEYAEQEERVTRGAALLDDNVLGWWDLVDTGSLNLSSFEMCVLGQVFSSYGQGLWELTIQAEGQDARHGFCPDTPQETRVQTALWRKVIQERRDDHG